MRLVLTSSNGGACMIADTYDPTDYSIETCILGESNPFLITNTTASSSLQMNLSVSSYHHLKFWGQLLTQHQLPLYKVDVELIEVRYSPPQFTFTKLANTLTDASGFYYFEHTSCDIGCYYLNVHSHNVLYNHLLFSNLNRCYHKPCSDCSCFKQFQKEVSYDITKHR